MVVSKASIPLGLEFPKATNGNRKASKADSEISTAPLNCEKCSELFARPPCSMHLTTHPQPIAGKGSKRFAAPQLSAMVSWAPRAGFLGQPSASSSDTSVQGFGSLGADPALVDHWCSNRYKA